MSIISIAKKFFEVSLKPNLIFGHSKYLFILSHMRSRSSVLSHILGSNDRVCGYSELHLPYVSYIAIMRMRLKLYLDLKSDLRDKYLMDKILHNNCEISNEMWEVMAPKVIFLLREPESTIKSIINVGNITGVDWYKSPKKASEYYCSRLLRLAEYAEMYGGDSIYIDSDDLLNKTDHVLSELTGWLGLDTPLVKNYMTFNNSGKPGAGDPSGIIQTGKLVKTNGYPDINIPREILQIAESSYEKCKASLMQI